MDSGQILETLLDSFSYAIKSGGPEECAQQFSIWMGRVRSALAVAGMNRELQIWIEEMDIVEFDPEEESFPAQAESMKALLIAMLSKSGSFYVDVDRINELRKIQSYNFDLAKLIMLCEEINICWGNRCYFAVASLSRAILDHIPPIFGFDTFSKVANNYPGGKSFKESMLNLDQSSRKIADSHLHSQVQEHEVLPNNVQVNFSSTLDVLLVEILKLLGKKDI